MWYWRISLFIYECRSIFPIRDQCAATSTNVMTNAHVSIIERAEIASQRKKPPQHPTTEFLLASTSQVFIYAEFQCRRRRSCQSNILEEAVRFALVWFPSRRKRNPRVCCLHFHSSRANLLSSHFFSLLLPSVPYKVSLNAFLFFFRATKKFQRLSEKRGDSSTHRNKSECLFE